MVCKNCGANLKGNPDKCPLCDFEFTESREKVKKRKRGAGIYKNPFTPIYIFTVLAVVVVLFIIVRFFKMDHSLWIGVLFGGTLVYFLITHTILGMRNYASKISHLSHAVCIYLIILFESLRFHIGYIYIYPSLQALFFVLSVVLFACRFKVFKPYISGFLVQTFFSYIPLSLTLAYGLNFTASLVIAVIETIFTLALVIIFPKEIINQIKRFLSA